jgi:hypothetical protein
MSIYDVIDDLVNTGRLFYLEPVLDDPVERTMLMSPEIRALLEGPWDSNDMEDRCGQLRDDLERFVTGGAITLCFDPYIAQTAYFGLLDPPTDAIWDLRSRDPDPGLRVLGAFADKDVFVSLLCAPRSVPVEWLNRKPLNDTEANPSEWGRAIRQANAMWHNLFPTYRRHIGKQHDDYVTGAFIL